jgi:hypothetical protein
MLADVRRYLLLSRLPNLLQSNLLLGLKLDLFRWIAAIKTAPLRGSIGSRTGLA